MTVPFVDGGATTAAATTGTTDDGSVHRVVYNSTTLSYPARPNFLYVEWVGPVDPGTLALVNDTWVDTAP